MKLSVVIATLGGGTLKDTITSINQSTIIPDEILICTPEPEIDNIEINDDNVRKIMTKDRGQVSQRAFGFNAALGEYVMQMDDDILLDRHCIEILMDTLNSENNKVAVAPVMLDVDTHQSIYSRKKYHPYIETVYYYLMNGKEGYQPGKIDKTGSAVGISSNEFFNDTFETEWLAGGCVMHFRENLVLKNYFPFKGKAFGEDVVHSFWLKKNGVRLLVNKQSKCYLDKVEAIEHTFKQWLHNLYGDYKVRRHLMSLKKSNSFRIYFFYIVSILSYIYKRLISNYKSK